MRALMWPLGCWMARLFGSAARGGKGFKELRQSVSNDWGGSKPPVAEEDKEFLEKKEKMHDIEQQIINASQQDTIHEYLGMIMAVQGAFADRSCALLTVQTLLSELSSLQARGCIIKGYLAGDKSRIRKIEELKETIKVTEAIREYERIKENNRSVVKRLDRERRADFMNMIKSFVVNEVHYY